MEELNLDRLGILETHSVLRNPSYDQLWKLETNAMGDELEKGVVTNLGAVCVKTGQFTGRSPKDKYIVREKKSERHVWWEERDTLGNLNGSDNRPISVDVWNILKDKTSSQLNNKSLYVVDAFCGVNEKTRLSIRLVTEVAWAAHFVKNMFIRPTEDELKSFSPDWTILHAPKSTVENFNELNLRSNVYIAFNIEERMTVIGGTWYGGEMKKGIFSMMNYFLPLKGIGAFHCSANKGKSGDTALFFGLSGTGKTTLSTDPHRQLIGDDEHGWDDDGVFNFEGGCYAKCIDLSESKEPDIYRAIRKDALLENVVFDKNGNVDFTDDSITENTRVSYPIYHIENICLPSKGTHPQVIVFLTADAFGVLPPVARLTLDQAMYYYLSGYTAKVAGTELGVTEPTATFSACFGQPFLTLHPTKYADILGQKIKAHNAKVYMINTGWTGGSYGLGKRIDLQTTRRIVDAVVDGRIENCEWEKMSVLNIDIPKGIDSVESTILNPKNTWNDGAAYDQKLTYLAKRFVENFSKFTGTNLGRNLISVGPDV